MAFRISERDIIFLCKTGSHLYGTNIPTSDIDIRGVALEPIDSILGLNPFDQQEYPNEDKTVYGLRKFLELARMCNPNILELLFVPDSMTLVNSEYWQKILQHRRLFLGSQQIVKTFIGYAVGQAKKMVTHNRWVTEDAPKKPDPADYGRILLDNGKEKWTDYNRKITYDQQLAEYANYHKWVTERNKNRSELELKFGYDTKNAMHLVRLCQQAEEVLLTGNITFPRPNAEWLLSIRREGIFTYEEIMEWFDEQQQYLNSLIEQAVIPKKSDANGVNNLATEINYDHIRNELG